MKEIRRSLLKLYFNEYFPCADVEPYLASQTGEDILISAHKEKILPSVLKYLQHIGRAVEIPISLRELYEINKKDKEMQAAVRTSLCTQGAASFCAIYLKGVAYERFYPFGRDRFSYDMDIYVKDEGSFAIAAEILRGLGLTMSPLISVGQRKDFGRFGLARFEIAELEGSSSGLELLFGHFGITPVTSIFSEDLIIDPEETTDRMGNCIRVLDATSTLLVMLAEYSTRESINIRDLYDANLLCTRYTGKVDLQRLGSLLEKYGLTHVPQRLVQEIEYLPPDIDIHLMKQLLSALCDEHRAAPSNLVLEHIKRYPKRLHFGLPEGFITTALLRLRVAIITRYRLNERWASLLWFIDGYFLAMYLFNRSLRLPCAELNESHPGREIVRGDRYPVITVGRKSYLMSCHGVVTDNDFEKCETSLRSVGK